MLVSLTIRNLVLVDELTLELGARLNVISGETGAGKSILVDALALVLGARARPEVVRTGCDTAEVEALFDLGDAPDLRARLEAEGLGPAEETELVVRRVVATNGRSRAYVNGKLVTASQLADLTRGVVDVSSQHESQSLCDASTHADLLDAYARLGELRHLVSTEVAAASETGREVAAVRARAEALAAREDFLRFQLSELDELGVQPGEERELEGLRGRLRHTDRLASATRGAVARLDEGSAEGSGSILDALRRVSSDVSRAAELDPSLSGHVGTLDGAVADLTELARALGRYADDVDSDPARLGEIEERLFKIQRVSRKHVVPSEELPARREAIVAELAALDQADSTIADLEERRRTLVAAATASARELSAKRHEAARALGDAIAGELASLAMGRARIVVDVAPVPAPGEPPGDDDFAVALGDGGRARLTRSGIDRVEIMIAPNPGEDPRPLRRIASGGELSRALLAVKRVLASGGPAGLYVFDEVDAGVGGAVAEAIGRKIADVARHHQVVCITHLAQIAAFADVHFAVSKHEHDGRTVSEVRRLETRQRVEELARMLGGVSLTGATRKAAQEMISTARAAYEASVRVVDPIDAIDASGGGGTKAAVTTQNRRAARGGR